jgi:hypothetical protein
MKKPKEKPDQRRLEESIDLPCPFCGQLGTVSIDEGGGERQTFVEDCSECCKPRVVHVDSSRDVTKGVRVWLERGDGL